MKFEFLIEHGYEIFRISKGLLRPLLISPLNSIDTSNNFDPINYLATINPQRAIERLQAIGWNSLCYYFFK